LVVDTLPLIVQYKQTFDIKLNKIIIDI